MASTSDSATSNRLTQSPKINKEWKRNIWNQKIVTLLNGNFAEGLEVPTKPLIINAGGSVLRLFLAWLYSGKIDMPPPVNNKHNNKEWYPGTTKLYVFADELNCVALQRSIMSTLVRNGENLLALASFGDIGLLSNSSLESSGLYQYNVEAYNEYWTGNLSNGCRDAPSAEDPMPPHFAYRLLLKRFEKPQDDNKDCVCCHDPCRYHGHESEEERRATCGALDIEFEDDQREALDFESETESEPESISDIALNSALRNKSAEKKRRDEDADATTSSTKHVKTT